MSLYMYKPVKFRAYEKIFLYLITFTIVFGFLVSVIYGASMEMINTSLNYQSFF